MSGKRYCKSLLMLGALVFSPMLIAQGPPMGGGPGGPGGPHGPEGPTVQGIVTAAGAPARHAKVLAIGPNGQVVKSTKTNGKGQYTFYSLRNRPYVFRVIEDGFKTEEISNVFMHPGVVKVDAQLEAGASSEVVRVDWQDAGPGGEPGALIGGPGGPKSDDENLPLSSRNYSEVAGTSKGVTGVINDASAVGATNSSTFFVGGSSLVNMTIDGASVPMAENPNPDATEAHSMSSWSYDAGPQRYSGLNLGVMTKSGGKQYHGSIFEYDRNDIFNANDYFRKQQSLARPVLKQNQYGFAVGGSILPRRLYFFVSFQGTRQSNGVDMTGNANAVKLFPFPSDRSSKARIAAAMAPSIHPGDSNYLTAHGGEQVADNGANISDVAYNLLTAKLSDGSYAIPGSGTSGELATSFSSPATYKEDQSVVNLDYKISPKHELAERLFISHPRQHAAFDSGPTSLPGSPSDKATKNIYGTLRLNSTITQGFANELRFSGQRLITKTVPHSFGTNDQFGIKSLSSVNLLDVFIIKDIFTIGGTDSGWKNVYQNGVELADTISWATKRHWIRAGFEGELHQYNVADFGEGRGQMTFYSIADFLIGKPGGTCSSCNGSAYSNVYKSTAATTAGIVYHAYRYRDFSLYVQDSVKLASRLKADIGMRWEYFGWPSDSTGNMTTFSATYSPEFSSISSSGTFAGYVVPANFKGTIPADMGVTRLSTNSVIEKHPSRLNLSPRLGLVWRPFEKSDLTLDGGYGVYYDIISMSMLASQTSIAAPYGVTVGAEGTSNASASIANPYPNTSVANSGWGTARTYDASTYASSGLSINAFTPDLRAPQTQKWNLDIHKRLPYGVEINAGYAGLHTIHLFGSSMYLNEARNATAQAPINGIGLPGENCTSITERNWYGGTIQWVSERSMEPSRS